MTLSSTILSEDIICIPREYHSDFNELRTGRKVIIECFFQIRQHDRRTIHQIIPLIAQQLGYKIDVNGTNTYLYTVIREFVS